MTKATKRKRIWEEKIFIRLMQACISLVITIMIMILYTILKRGLPLVNFEILSTLPKGGFYFGGRGGILNAIVGSLYLTAGSTFLAFIISLPTSMYINIHLRKRPKLQNSIRLFVDVLWGVPSVVYGAFAFSVMIYFGMRTSLLAGILTVAVFIVPIMLRSMDEVLKNVPFELYETALSLGSTRHETAYRIYFRQCLPGILTAFLLSFGRAIGDAAAPLFTTGFTDNIPTSLSQPVATLPLSIFFQLTSPIPEVQNRAFVSALVLTVIILLISISCRIIFHFFTKYRIN